MRDPGNRCGEIRGLRRKSSEASGYLLGRAACRYRSKLSSIGTAPVGSTSSANTSESVGKAVNVWEDEL